MSVQSRERERAREGEPRSLWILFLSCAAITAFILWIAFKIPIPA